MNLYPSADPRTQIEDPHEEHLERGRKRHRDEINWKKNIKKLRRNSGKSYINRVGNPVPGKEFQKNYDCRCKRNCRSKFSEEKLQNFFQSFWKLGDYSQQNTFLRGVVQANKTQRSRPRNNSATPKAINFKYSLRVDEESIQVCKKYFLGILQISWGRLYRCLSKNEIFCVTDGRGRHTPANKIDDADVISHIKSFPTYQSHYSRKDNPERKYLHPNLTIRKMFNLYVEKCQAANKMPVKEKFYYHVFNTKFNLHFKIPSKDTCRMCDELQMKIQAENAEEKKKELKLEKDLHLARADQAREQLKRDKETASEQIYVATFDLQKALPFPKLSTSTAYYKRNMYVYNLGIHNFNSNTGFMYVWDETEGGRGSQDIASCIVKHIKERASTYKHIILYSDACTGQNRNIKMALSLLKLVQDEYLHKIETIEHKFLVSGHSFLPNDADFGVIEKCSRQHHQIFSPNDWIEIIKSAKRKPPHFKVINMKRNEFFSTKNLENSITKRKVNTDGHPINWLKIRCMRFEREYPFSIKYKESLNDFVGFSQMNLNSTNNKRKNYNLNNIKQEELYPNRRLITASKKKDMMELLAFIPPINHAFYKNLLTEHIATRNSKNAIEDNRESDDEIIYE